MLKSSYSFSVLSTGGLSDEGYAHKKNEDAWDIFELQSGAGTITVGIVADGVTSKAGGATASGLATETIRQVMFEAAPSIYDPAVLQETIDDAIHKANRAILEEARKHPEIGNMSTTLVLAAVGWGQLQVAYLGDSRAYLLRDNQLHRLTLDHTWAQEAVDKGLIEAEELKTHPNRNVIRRFMGINRQIDIDRQIVKPGHYHRSYLERGYTRALQLNQHDVLLLCSDGLTERTNDDEIASILNRRVSQPKRAVSDLIQLALTRQEQDNITAVVLSLNAERNGTAVVKILAWSAALVAMISVAILGYTVLRQSQISESVNAAVVSTSANAIDGSTAPTSANNDAHIGAVNRNATDAIEAIEATEDASPDNAQSAGATEATDVKEPPGTVEIVSAAVHEEGAQNRTIQTSQEQVNVNTVPYAETKAAQTAAAAEPRLSAQTPTANPTANPTATPELTVPAATVPVATVPVATSTALPAEPAQRVADIDPDLAEDAITSSNSSQEAALLSSILQTEDSEEQARPEGQAFQQAASSEASSAISDSSTSSQGDNRSTEENAQRVAKNGANSTPTRKPLPTPKPTATDTPTRLPTPLPTNTTTVRSGAASSAAPNVGESGQASTQAAEEGPAGNGVADNGVVAPGQTVGRAEDLAQQEEGDGNARRRNQVQIILPPDKETIRAGDAVDFQWITDYILNENEAFEVVVWKPKSSAQVAMADGMGMVDIRNSPPIRVDETTWLLKTAPPRNFEAGEYKWAVIVVETEPEYRRIQQLGQETRQFILTKQTNNNGGSGNAGKTEDASGESVSGGCSGSSCGDR